MITEEMIRELKLYGRDDEFLNKLANELISEKWDTINISGFVLKPPRSLYEKHLFNNFIDDRDNVDITAAMDRYAVYRLDPATKRMTKIVSYSGCFSENSESKITALKVAVTMANEKCIELNDEMFNIDSLYIPVLIEKLEDDQREMLFKRYEKVSDEEFFSNAMSIVSIRNTVYESSIDEYSDSGSIMDYVVIKECDDTVEYRIEIMPYSDRSKRFVYDKFICRYAPEMHELRTLLLHICSHIEDELENLSKMCGQSDIHYRCERANGYVIGSRHYEYITIVAVDIRTGYTLNKFEVRIGQWD